MDKYKDLLKNTILLSHLNDEIIVDLVPFLQSMTVEPGDVIFEQGESAKTFYLIEEGIVDIQAEPLCFLLNVHR